jgi:hypothetical protein
LGSILGVSTKTVGGYIKELVQAGLISSKRRGLNKTNLYTLHKWKSSGLKGKKVLNQKGKKAPSQNSSQLPINHTKPDHTNSESVSPSDKYRLGPTEVQKLMDKYGVTEKAIMNVVDKYKNYCADKGKDANVHGLKLFLSRERWEYDDYCFEKQIAISMQGW